MGMTARRRPHSNGNGSISPGSVIPSDCRPSRIAPTISGAGSVSRRTSRSSPPLHHRLAHGQVIPASAAHHAAAERGQFLQRANPARNVRARGSIGDATFQPGMRIAMHQVAHDQITCRIDPRHRLCRRNAGVAQLRQGDGLARGQDQSLLAASQPIDTIADQVGQAPRGKCRLRLLLDGGVMRGR